MNIKSECVECCRKSLGTSENIEKIQEIIYSNLPKFIDLLLNYQVARVLKLVRIKLVLY